MYLLTSFPNEETYSIFSDYLDSKIEELKSKYNELIQVNKNEIELQEKQSNKTKYLKYKKKYNI